MSATVWLPQPAGQPDQWMRTAFVVGTLDSSPFTILSARLLVSITAKLQNSSPVQLTSPRSTPGGSYRSALSSGSAVSCPSLASGTCGMRTFWSTVRRDSPVPYYSDNRASSWSWSPVTRPTGTSRPT